MKGIKIHLRKVPLEDFYELWPEKFQYQTNGVTQVCAICFDSYPLDRIQSAGCGHPFGNKCWTTYISTSINDGPGCLSLRCPVPSCAAVGVNMVNFLASNEDKKKYDRYLLRSYIEDNRKTKWCPLTAMISLRALLSTPETNDPQDVVVAKQVQLLCCVYITQVRGCCDVLLSRMFEAGCSTKEGVNFASICSYTFYTRYE